MANGIIVIDKPAGWTSMDVCGKLRGLLGERRIGHAGTLDPMATGVLPVFVGRATRAVTFAESDGKEYIAGLRLGLETDTQDSTGQTVAENPVLCNRQTVEQALEQFRGEIFQIPPMYSALKRNGKKLYELARKGEVVERAPRPVTIAALELLSQEAPEHYTLGVRCSKGTYIRTLCHDIGQVLGCGGVMDALRRTEAAGFTLAEAVTLEQVVQAAESGQAEALLTPIDRFFAAYPSLNIQGKAEQLCRNGNPFPWEGGDGTYRVYGADGSFLMLGRLEQGQMRTLKSFFSI